MNYIIFFVLIFILVDYVLGIWHRKKQELEANKEEQICSAIEAAILPSNMGKSIDEVKENLSKAEIQIKFHISDDK